MTVTGQLIRYRCACNALLRLFCDKQGFPMSDTYWIADRVGEVADCASFCPTTRSTTATGSTDAPRLPNPNWRSFTARPKRHDATWRKKWKN